MKRILLIIFFLHAHILLGSPFLQPQDVITPFLSQYHRPFTLVEIQPGSKTASVRIGQLFYDAVCVILESQNYQDVYNRCCRSWNTLLLKKPMNVDDYQRLGDCEHFDVVLIPNAQKFAANNLITLLNLGDHIFYEIVTVAQTKSSNCAYLGKLVSNWTDENNTEHYIYYYYKPRDYLMRKEWNSDCTMRGNYTIKADIDTKYFIHYLRKELPSIWLAGINLATFVALDGIYPCRDWILHKIYGLADKKHNDLWVANIVIQGYNLALIDCDDARRSANFKKHFKKLINQFS